MENNYAFKSIEVTGTTKEEAFANTPFTAPVDKWTNATQKFNNWKKEQKVVTSAAIKQFKLDYLKDKKIAPGAAAYIVIKSAVKNTRKRPYKCEDVKHEGACRTAKVFQLIDKATGVVLAETTAKEVPQTRVIKDANGNPVKDENGNVKKEILKDEDGNTLMKISAETKAHAKQLMRDLYTNKGFTGDIVCKKVYKIFGGDDVVFTSEYTPSSESTPGTYEVFGYVLD